MSHSALWRSTVTLLFVAVLIPPGLWVLRRVQLAQDVAYFRSFPVQIADLDTISEVDTDLLKSWLPDVTEPWILPLFERPKHLTVVLRGEPARDTAVAPLDVKRVGGLTTLTHFWIYEELADSPGHHASRDSELDLSFLKTLPQLKLLSISHPNLKKSCVHLIAQLSQLEQLDLQHCGITDTDLAQLREMSQLKRLKLPDNPITDAGTPSLAGMVNLEQLNLVRTKITRRTIPHLARLTRMYYLWFSSDVELSDNDLSILSQLPLQALTISSPRVTAVGFRHVGHMAKLKLLYIDNTTVSADDLAPLAKLTALETLRLPASPRLGGCLKHLVGLPFEHYEIPLVILTDADIPHLVAIKTRLQNAYLNLSQSQVTDEGLAALAGTPELIQVNLSQTSITDAGLPPLATMPDLTQLILDRTAITDNGLETISRMSGLEWLDLSETAVTDAGLSWLAGLKRLDLLDLKKTAISDAGVRTLLKLESLSWLNLEETSITDAALESLAQFPHLSTLKLSRTNVTAKGLTNLARLTRLHHLVLSDLPVDDATLAEIARCTNLSELDLSGTDITDAGIEVLLECPHLRTLSLSRTQVTDAGLVKLVGLTNLLEIEVDETSITAEGMETFHSR